MQLIFQFRFKDIKFFLSFLFKAGQRAAIEVMDDLRPQCLSSKDYILLKKSSYASVVGIDRMNGIPSGGIIEELWFSNVFRWTMILPAVSACIGYTVFKLRNTYSHLLNTYR